MRCSDLARETGAKLGPTTRFEDLQSTAGGEIEPPLTGTLERQELGALIELLATATSSPEACWFG